jgi:hypothetical protein
VIRTSFNGDWQFRPKVNPFAELAGTAVPFEPVTVPHDAMLTRDREATADGAATASNPAATSCAPRPVPSCCTPNPNDRSSRPTPATWPTSPSP